MPHFETTYKYGVPRFGQLGLYMGWFGRFWVQIVTQTIWIWFGLVQPKIGLVQTVAQTICLGLVHFGHITKPFGFDLVWFDPKFWYILGQLQNHLRKKE